MNKKWGMLLAAVILIGLVWYLFLKPHDYLVRFEVKALPGTINQTAKSWNAKLDSAEFVTQKELTDFKYRITSNDTTDIYHWKIESLSDSTSKVRVYVTDTAHSIANRLAIPFSETVLEKRSKKMLQGFLKEMQDHLKDFKVKVTGRTKLPPKYCACIALTGKQKEKASGMMKNYTLLSGIMAGRKDGLDGRPLVEIEDWNMQNDSIAYNFCFPVIKSDSLPQRPGIFYKEIAQKPALQAIYNGNYITSDRAWYALVDYAKKNNIPIDKKPVEIFRNNPNMGGNDLEWETEVFMPIKE